MTGESLDGRLKKLERSILSRLAEMEKQVDLNGNKLLKFEQEYATARELDLFTFADHSERADYASNLLKANCVLLTGITQIHNPTSFG